MPLQEESNAACHRIMTDRPDSKKFFHYGSYPDRAIQSIAKTNEQLTFTMGSTNATETDSTA